jgi:hypothetical protein
VSSILCPFGLVLLFLTNGLVSSIRHTYPSFQNACWKKKLILHWTQLQLGRYVMSLALSFFVVHSRVIIVSKLVKRWMLWHLGDPSDMVLSCTNQIDQCFSSDLIAAFSVL